MAMGKGAAQAAARGGGGAQNRLEFLERLKRITHQIHSADNLDEILIKIKESIASLFGADRITIYAVDKVKKEIFSKYMVGSTANEIRVPISKQSVSGYVAATGSQISIADAYNDIELLAIYPDLKFDRSWDKQTGYRTKQILCGPIMYEKFLLGIVQVINKKTGTPFTNEDRTTMQEICEVLGLAFYNYQKRTVKYKSKFEFLIHQNTISKTDLEKAMAEARTRNWDITEVLMKIFKIDKAAIGKSLSAYYNVPFAHYDDGYNPPLELLDHLAMKNPFKFMEANGWVPYRLNEGRLIIACEDPSDHTKISDLQHVVKGGVFDISVALSKDILQMISKLSGNAVADMGGADIDDIMAEGEGDEDGASKDFEDTGMSVAENDSGVVKLVNKIILDAYSKGVSDIHIETYPGKANTIVRFRHDGVCYEYRQIPANWKKALIARIKIMSGLNIAEKRLPQDGKIKLKLGAGKSLELRVATVPTNGGNEDAVMRILAASEPIPLDEMNISPRNLKMFTDEVVKPYGLILVVGPTGSGKTTTLHSALGYINTVERKIWTAEDPVEITQVGLRQVQVRKDINLTFANCMRAFLRADPDVIMIGEMRDAETAGMGIEAALTGHIVFSTLHTNSAPETITRLLDLDLDPFSFADSLLLVLAQRLVRTLCKKCKVKYTPDKEELAMMENEYGKEMWPELNVAKNANFHKAPEGKNECEKCGGKGMAGRTGLHEVLTVNDKTLKLIQKKAPVELIRAECIKNGMRTLKQDGVYKVMKGDTTMEQVRKVCSV